MNTHSGDERAARDSASGREGINAGDSTAVFMISVAAELAGMHAQTLRTYDRLGLVTPQRTSGGGRRYSSRDVELLREIQRLSQEEGVNLAGIKRIIDLSNQVDALRVRVGELTEELERSRSRRGRELVPVPRTSALVVWQPRRRRPDHGRSNRSEGQSGPEGQPGSPDA
ncbi:MerR family transcriptional regulator [Gordonia amarae]|uniref:Heat shock protein HspR n=3 Tax=Gordonia amarae TaxID=36821 RepID=G7GUG0_9ACTN|nr:MerR family transcriptional regulator/heat shock protein HspR [Gordonia amarae]GAB07235.1 heat shock protein HspR [Gordonia amarae NBRC 15530]QHN16163.1 MerR family transcriptional regulator [Gordonia amarae]QHN20732.1 MerR family transcriptional regulator [Gordonia amarae]QHN29583.1 MerR family transcriptional regulator [Gordonia amarae]